ncbi:MAG: peptidoglycan editing factor PgeF [Cellvibrionaceae bacterium]
MNGNVIGFEPEWQTDDRRLPANVKAFVTYRAGGCSAPPFDSNNLALHVGDDGKNVEKNRETLSSRLKLSAPIAWLTQIHSDRIITESNFFAEIDDRNHPMEADGVVSCSSKLVCAVMTADCLPVLFCNKQGTQVAAIHAGWRGLANGILKKSVSAFNNNSADELMVFLGPAITQNCYEVGEEVVSALELTVSLRRENFARLSVPVLKDSFLNQAENQEQKSSRIKMKKYHLDMYAVAKAQLSEVGVLNISGGDRCSFSEKNNFYSYRRDGQTGRMASLIWLES